MRVVVLMGGVGNRLFQIARAWDLKTAGHDPVLLPIEVLPEIDFLASKVLGWTRQQQWIDLDALANALGLGMSRRKLPMAARLAIHTELLRLRLPRGKARLNLTAEIDNRKAQIGYFQGPGCLSAASIAAVSDAIAAMLPLADLPAHSAVVHVRGGDFAQEDRLSAVAVTEFEAATSGDCVGITNDPTFVKANFPSLDLAPSTGALDDFLKLCKAAQIMPSNSTFCFWACTIATRHMGAKLWVRPADAYWSLLGPEAWSRCAETEMVSAQLTTTRSRRRVLVISYALSPVLGSEYRSAWELVRQFSTSYDVTVIFGDSDGLMGEFGHFDAHAATHSLNFTPVKVAPTAGEQWVARLMLRMPWALFFPLLLQRWHRKAFETAKAIHAQVPFDVVHQLGPIGFRNPGYAWRLGCHSYWGPIGGAQFIDQRMIRDKWSAYYAEALFRNLSVYLQGRSGYIASAARGFDRLSFATVENADYFGTRFGRSGPIISDQGLYLSDRATATETPSDGPLRVVWAGSLTPRKNVNALIEIVRNADPDIRFDVVGDGPLRQQLAALARVHLNLTAHGRLPRPQLMEILQAADVILLTSLSEANTAILFEGLENGCIPIVPAINGFVSTLNDEVAILIRQGDPDRAVADTVAAIHTLKDPKIRQRYRVELSRHLETLTWAQLGAAHEASYV